MKRNVKRALKTMVKNSYSKRIYYQYEDNTVLIGDGVIFFRILASEYESLKGECFAKCELLEMDIDHLAKDATKGGEPARMQNMLVYSGDVLTRIYKSNFGEIIGVKEDYIKICQDLEISPGELMTTGGNKPLYTNDIIICPIHGSYRDLICRVLGVDQ